MLKAMLVAAFFGMLILPVVNANAAEEAATTEAAPAAEGATAAPATDMPASEGEAAAPAAEEGSATEEHKKAE